MWAAAIGVTLLLAGVAVFLAARYAYARGRLGAPLLPRGSQDVRRASRLYELAERAQSFYDSSAHPSDLLGCEPFCEGVSHLAYQGFSEDDLFAYFTGDNGVIACMAGEALREREASEPTLERMFDVLANVGNWPLYFALRAAARVTSAERPVVGRVLARGAVYTRYRQGKQILTEFLRERAAVGETPGFDGELDACDAEQVDSLRAYLLELPDELRGSLPDDFEEWRRGYVDVGFLESVGSLLPREPGDPDAGFDFDALRDAAAALEADLLADPPRSTLLVGDSGVGKSQIVRCVARSLQERGWLVFEAGATGILAGQTFIGQFEERIQKLVAQLRGARRLLWIVPQFDALLEAGRHQHSTVGALDAILPHVERGEIALLGECLPGPYERLALAIPRLSSALAVRRVTPMDADAARALGRRWMERHAAESPDNEAVLAEAWQLAQQYLGDRAAPGNLLRLLEITAQRLAAGRSAAGTSDERPPITVDDLIVTLTDLTGLPASLLDDREAFDLDALRGLFARRVIGQPEAVECLVERVAMVKAGLADPTRPFGVFLFAGPTGTGKTEIAKTLAEFLFGSPDRMIRVDMSELQSADDLERLVGSDSPGASRQALVDRIRRQPFSVVLLDEFEKAHHRVWDLFLQVFDDGRLTDRRGHVADFRYSIILLTSNLGGLVPTGDRLGFEGGGEQFNPRTVLRTVKKAFSPEFQNRLDRVVVFRPLDRETMRGILRAELDLVFRRRGLRARTWAVEWDPAAIEFLLEKGFTVDLGARPLKRAVERHLLAPLARTIVGHEFPTGDQFLYVTLGNQGLEVEFIDPDAPAEAPQAPEPEATAEASRLRLVEIALEPAGSPEELELLSEGFERLAGSIKTDAWRERKQTALELTGLPDFWKSPDRFEILGQVEYQGRIEAGLRRTGSLLSRLRSRQREHVPQHLVAALAQNLYLLSTARDDVEHGRPHEAFLQIEGGREGGLPDADCDRFAERIAGMYLAWGERRRMRVEMLEERAGDAAHPYRLRLAVKGFGSHSILAPEDGIHVLETPSDRGRAFDRSRAHVRVLAPRGDPGDGSLESTRRAAERALADQPVSEMRIVRRYRLEPSPLVRDAVRGWRTGRIDEVLRGDFDLFEPDS